MSTTSPRSGALAYTWPKALGVADTDTSGLSPHFTWSHRNSGTFGLDRRYAFDPTFGNHTNARDPRLIQLCVRLNF